MDESFMKKRSVFPLLLSMALPMVISMTVNSLYNIVDSYFVAKISEDAMTALSLVFPVQNFINAVAIGFGIGINAVISFHLGAQDHKKANTTATRGVLLAAIHGIVMAIACIVIMPPFLRMFTGSETVVDLGFRYSRIAFAFAPIISLALAFEKIFQSMGKMNVTMVALICGAGTNIILDPVLIFGLGPFPQMGIEGAALATGIGQILTLVIYLIVYCIRPTSVRISRKYLARDRSIDARLYAIGIPAVLNMALPSLLISALNAILAAYAEIYVVVLGVYYKLQTFLYLPANGIVQGMRPIIGYNFGAMEYKRVQKIYQIALGMCAVIMAAGTVVCQLIPQELIGMFSTNPATIAAGGTALRIISAGFLLSTVSVTTSGALEGLGKGVPSLVISLLRYTIIIIPIGFLLSRVFGPDGVWHAFWIAEVITAMASLLIYRRTVLKKMVENPE